jgi:hypothetical protein
MTLMPDEKTWEKAGVRITYLCFETMFSLKVQNIMRAKYLRPNPTPENPDQQIVDADVYTFYTAMPLVMRVDLEDGAASWGSNLKKAVESPDWLSDPSADFERLQRRAPADLFFECYEGYKATREQSFVAPQILQLGEPKEPPADPETGEVDQAAANFTSSSTPNGGMPLTVMPSQKRAEPSRSNQRKAK